MELPLAFDAQLLKKGALVLRALKNGLRLKILRLIHQKGRITVTEIYVVLRIEQSVASQQLAILRQQDIVNTERDGKKTYYSINYDRLDSVNQSISNVVEK